MKLVIDSITIGISAADKSAAFGKIILYIGLIGLATLLSHALSSINSYLSEHLSLNIWDYLSDILHSKSIEVDLEYYENPDYFDTLHRAQQGAIQKPTSAFNNSVQLLQNGLSMVAMLGVLFSFHWLITVILVFAAIPGVLFRLKFSQRLYRWDRSKTSTQRHVSYFQYLLTSDYFAKEIRLFQLGPLFIKRFHELRELLRKEKLSIAVKRTIADFIAQFITVLAIYGSFTFMAFRAVHGLITLGDLVMYYQAFQRGMNFFRTLLSNGASLMEDTLYLSNLFEFLDLQPKITDPAEPQTIFSTITRHIEWKNVSFEYPSTDRYVLDDISISIKPGEQIALVGENGAGKSTFIKLLCRLYDPTGGDIYIDGRNIKEYRVQDLRKQISVVFQDFVRYHMKVRDNIWFGNVDLEKDDPQIQSSAIAAGVDSVIRKLSNGYDTTLGKMFEHGEELSMGEWQKIALARAFLRPAQIIVLDEPTSALDAKAEYDIFKKFKKLAQGKTAFLISHRLSSARLADRILVLENGKIVEDGSHDELIALNGTYAKMFALQSENYR